MIEDTIQHMQYTTYFKLNMTRNRYSCSSRFFSIDTTLTNAVCALIYTTEQFKVFRCTGHCVVHFTLRCDWVALLYQFLRVPNQLYRALYNIQVHKSISRYNAKNAILRS